MDKFSNYTLRDFVLDPDFVDWVKHPTAEKDHYWVHIQQSYPDQIVKMQKAVEIVKAFSAFSPTVEDATLLASKENIIASIRQLEEEKILIKKSIPIWMMVAAALLLVVGAIGSYQLIWNHIGTSSSISSSKVRKEVVLENTTQETSTHYLPDSSVIELFPNSKISYLYHKIRAVSLEGKAYFSVKPNTDKPFVVYTSGVTTRVLGTRFLVDAYDQASVVKVSVSSGKVQVYPSNVSSEMANKKSLFLTSNQEASYEKIVKTLKKGIVDTPQIIENIASSENDIKIVNMPLSNLFEQLEKMYGIQFIYDQAKFINCRVNLSLSDEPLFEILELVGKLIDGHYNTQNGQVTFVGNGCK